MIATFVIPFYGENIGGGAETHCRRLVENLSFRGIETEVLTTTLRDLGTHWNSHYHNPGIYKINGVTVRRFSPRLVDTDLFVPINEKLMAREKISFEEEVFFTENAINSDELYAFIGDNQKERIYFFMPYCFGTSWNGTRVAPWKSFLIPCLHDEGYADMVQTRRMFDRASGVLFNSAAEMRLAMEKYDGLKMTESILMGEGVDEVGTPDPEMFRKTYGLGDEPFLVYVGRRDVTKNTPFLVECFARYKKNNPSSPLKLLLMGSGSVHVPASVMQDTLDLGFVTEEVKRDAISASIALCQPSVMESFSIVIMESWRLGRPVLVHSACGPTSDHVRASGGGFMFGDFSEFEDVVNRLLADSSIACEMGKRGREYVEQNYSWSVICRRFKKLIESCGELVF